MREVVVFSFLAKKWGENEREWIYGEGCSSVSMRDEVVEYECSCKIERWRVWW